MAAHRRFLSLEIPVGGRAIRVELDDGTMCVYDSEGETHYDGWATVQDVADGLVEWAGLAPGAAAIAAGDAVEQWVAWLGTRPHRFPRA